MVRINRLQADRETFANDYIDEEDVFSIRPFDETMMIVTYKDGRVDIVREYVCADEINLKSNLYGR